MEATTVTIRRAEPSDAESIHEVFVSAIWGIDDVYYDQAQKEAWEDVIKPESWPTRMLEQSFIVAETGGEVVGFAAWSEHMLEHFYVSPQFGRRGIGSQLLTEVTRHFSTRDLGLIASDNACDLYLRFGFIEEKRYSRPLGPVEVSCIRMKRLAV